MIDIAETNQVGVLLDSALAHAVDPGNVGDTGYSDEYDFLSGDIGFDALLDGTGNGILQGEHGLYGERGDEWLVGAADKDLLVGKSGNDLSGNRLSGGDDHDFLSGDIGIDALLDGIQDGLRFEVGDIGSDVLAGGAGPDVSWPGPRDGAGDASEWTVEFLAGADDIDLGADDIEGKAAADAVIEAGWVSAIDLGEAGGETGDTVPLDGLEAASILLEDDPII